MYKHTTLNILTDDKKSAGEYLRVLAADADKMMVNVASVEYTSKLPTVVTFTFDGFGLSDAIASLAIAVQHYGLDTPRVNGVSSSTPAQVMTNR